MAKRKRGSKYALYPLNIPKATLDALILDLGSDILAQTPYPSPKYPKAGPNPDKPFRVQTYGPGVKYNTEKPYESPDVRLKNATFNGKLLSAAQKKTILRKGLFWKIGGRPHRMSKVIRIPYTYKDPINGKPGRQTALIIGYEGAGGGCQIATSGCPCGARVRRTGRARRAAPGPDLEPGQERQARSEEVLSSEEPDRACLLPSETRGAGRILLAGWCGVGGGPERIGTT